MPTAIHRKMQKLLEVVDLLVNKRDTILYKLIFLIYYNTKNGIHSKIFDKNVKLCFFHVEMIQNTIKRK